MANYECACRTNYFRVTNEDRYQKLYAKLRSDDLYDYLRSRKKEQSIALPLTEASGFAPTATKKNMETWMTFIRPSRRFCRKVKLLCSLKAVMKNSGMFPEMLSA